MTLISEVVEKVRVLQLNERDASEEDRRARQAIRDLEWVSKVRPKIVEFFTRLLTNHPEMLEGGSYVCLYQTPEDKLLWDWRRYLEKEGFTIGTNHHRAYNSLYDSACWGEFYTVTTTYTLYWGNRVGEGVCTETETRI